MIKDLVCGMAVDRRNPPARAEYQGKEYLFCSVSCKDAFEKEPERYLSVTKATQSHDSEGRMIDHH